MPTWEMRPFRAMEKKTRSPFCNRSASTPRPASYCAAAERGRFRPLSWYTAWARPLQSKPSSGDVPPHWYGVPMKLSAVRTIRSRRKTSPLLSASATEYVSGLTMK